MNLEKFAELGFYTLPAITVGIVSYSLFNSYFKELQSSRKSLMQQENQKLSLPIRLQAYERLTLFLERINPTKLIVRIAPLSDDKFDYENLLINLIEQEFEHNLTQQIYISNASWNIILTAKNTTIQIIRKTAMSDKITNSFKLREKILSDLLENEAPSSIALSYLKSEISELI
ncbi:MAG: hypothetical protein H7239_04045 [Flavobacterium sp.]|nr:hypothetical protein [Flavobacterium sp.]